MDGGDHRGDPPTDADRGAGHGDDPARAARPVDLAVLSATFEARPGALEQLGGVLARYVVLARGVPGCRNVDLVASVTQPGRFLVLSKWDRAELVQAHLDSELMTSTARDVLALLAHPPELDLWDALSAHDLH